MGRLELPASCSQSKRATNCATPGYEIFQLWANMWSTPIFDQLPARGKVLSAQVSQGFPGFPRTSARTRASRSQSKRATNCANPGFLVIQFCSRCGQTCGQAFFLTISACGGSACIAGVSRNCGHSIFRLEVGATRSQSRRATNCATPGYFVILSGWAYSPKPGAIPTSLYPDIYFSP